ncbi:heavy-metal-associated domain-containing protein [Kitasatospora sp. NPDC004799]|uniref:heavy-metal-associated domain-containing protein n=1 Tax=Kitasatospora sp. NPDC004799 TaxID=3154460 RepID=UPI0033B9B990
MSCGHCEKTVSAGLAVLPGVTDVSADAPSGRTGRRPRTVRPRADATGPTAHERSLPRPGAETTPDEELLSPCHRQPPSGPC